ncbi:alpha/beta fold hydrolase [Streptomyces werraensis]|uniref:alpha/beta fold hydrolase n=1 Tax=Streptomyces werraensis TaxID=68284 RepID=UPI001CE2D878
MHARAAAPAGPALPLVLCHGRRDSFWRYTKVIDLLTDPAAHGGDPMDAFDVIVPDMPGCGCSHASLASGLNSLGVAGVWAELMTRLGYERFGAVGGDIGSHVSRYLALEYPERVVGAHRMGGGLPVYSGVRADRLARRPRRVDRGEDAAWSDCDGDIESVYTEDEILTNVMLY